MEHELPEAIQALAFRSGTEMAWLREDVPQVLNALLEKQMAVLGGEVWVVNGSKINAMPRDRTGAPGVYAWTTGIRKTGETWASFVKRSSDVTLKAMEDLDAENDILLQQGDRIYYNLTFEAMPPRSLQHLNP